MKSTTPEIAIAEAARDLLADQNRFIKGAWAAGAVMPDYKKLFKNPRKRYDADLRFSVWGGNTSRTTTTFEKSNDPKACAWCAEGAIMKSAGDLGAKEDMAYSCIRSVDQALGKSIQKINDAKGHAATVRAMDKAIGVMKAQLAKENKAACEVG